MDSITYTSWWARPAVQFDYAAFAAALEAELPRMTTDTSAAAKVDAAITYQWSMGFPKRRATSLRRLL